MLLRLNERLHWFLRLLQWLSLLLLLLKLLLLRLLSLGSSCLHSWRHQSHRLLLSCSLLRWRRSRLGLQVLNSAEDQSLTGRANHGRLNGLLLMCLDWSYATVRRLILRSTLDHLLRQNMSRLCRGLLFMLSTLRGRR